MPTRPHCGSASSTVGSGSTTSTSGTLWIAGTDTELERIDDWGSTLGSEGDEPDDNPGDQEEGDTEENPDIGEIRDPEIDEDGVNEPPVARDDVARTRADQPVVVDLVANDEDPDGDALMVASLDGVPTEVAVAVTPDQRSVQVVPPPGFTGNIAFSYTVSDGRGASASANVDVEVVSNDASNRPPIAQTDIAEVRGGASAAFNVLNNDSDPDGDTFVLSDVQVPSGRVIFDPSGEINFTPEPGSQAGTIELQYQIVDAFGATANGTVRVAIRLDTSNNEPRAVNDSASTVVGMPVTLNVLKNDADPDNDPLTVAGLPQLVSTTGNPNALEEISLLDDGEFFFLPTVAGDYVFLYAIIDGSERDAAYIRVRVDEPTENRPPTAIRDDVTISRGDTRNVYVLENDTDPDGDVIGIVDWSAGEGIEVEQVLGFAFRVTVLPDAPARTQFTYTMSDGKQRPVDRHGRRRGQRHRHARPAAGRPARHGRGAARPDGIGARARQRLRPRGRHAARRRRVRRPRRRPAHRPGRPGDLRVGRCGDRLVVHVRLRRRRRGRQPDRLARPGPARADRRRQPAAGRPARRGPHGVGTGDRHPRAVQRHRSRRRRHPDRDDHRPADVRHRRPSVSTARSATHRGSARADPTGFRYTVVDANGDRAVGEVVIGVLPADGENRAPTATDDTYTVIAGGDIQLLDVLSNDSDPDGDPLSIADVDAGSDSRGHRSVRCDQLRAAAHARRRRPPQTVSFAYEVADGRGGTDRALVTVEVVESDVPIAPIAVDDIAGPFSRGQGVARSNVLANDSDPDGRVADLTVTQRRSPPPDRRRRHRDDRRPAGHRPPRVHDHRRRRAGRRRPR